MATTSHKRDLIVRLNVWANNWTARKSMKHEDWRDWPKIFRIDSVAAAKMVYGVEDDPVIQVEPPGSNQQHPTPLLIGLCLLVKIWTSHYSQPNVEQLTWIFQGRFSVSLQEDLWCSRWPYNQVQSQEPSTSSKSTKKAKDSWQSYIHARNLKLCIRA